MSLTTILDWYGALAPGAKGKLSLHDLHRLAKALSSEAPPVSPSEASAGNLPPDEPNYKALYTELKGEVLEKVGVIGRIARSNDGSRTFDDCIRDLMLIDDQCRALSTLHDKLSSIEVRPEPSSDGAASPATSGSEPSGAEAVNAVLKDQTVRWAMQQALSFSLPVDVTLKGSQERRIIENVCMALAASAYARERSEHSGDVKNAAGEAEGSGAPTAEAAQVALSALMANGLVLPPEGGDRG